MDQRKFPAMQYCFQQIPNQNNFLLLQGYSNYQVVYCTPESKMTHANDNKMEAAPTKCKLAHLGVHLTFVVAIL